MICLKNKDFLLKFNKNGGILESLYDGENEYVGEKTAISLIQKYDSLDGVYENLDKYDKVYISE